MISNSRLTAGAAQTTRPLTRAEVEMCGRLNLLSQYNRSPPNSRNSHNNTNHNNTNHNNTNNHTTNNMTTAYANSNYSNNNHPNNNLITSSKSPLTTAPSIITGSPLLHQHKTAVDEQRLGPILSSANQLLLQCCNVSPVTVGAHLITKFDPVVGSGRRNGSRTESSSSGSTPPRSGSPTNVTQTTALNPGALSLSTAVAPSDPTLASNHSGNNNNSSIMSNVNSSSNNNSNNNIFDNNSTSSTTSSTTCSLMANNNNNDDGSPAINGPLVESLQTGNQLVAQILDILKRNKSGGGCGFCRRNREPPTVYMNHQLRNAQNQVTCPQLMKHVCELCGATGAQAHTRSYCSVSQGMLDAGLPEHHSTTRLLRNMSMVSNSRYNAAGKLRHR